MTGGGESIDYFGGGALAVPVPLLAPAQSHAIFRPVLGQEN